MPLGRRAGGEDVRDRHPAGADGGHRVVLRAGPVFHVQVADPVAEPSEQGRHVLPADRRPVGVDLQQHGVVERVGEHLKARPPVDRAEFEPVVVVTEPQPLVGRPGGGRVDLAGERGDRVPVGEPLRRRPRHDHRVRAELARAGEHRVGVVAQGLRVHGAHGETRFVEVAAQRLGVRQHVVRLDRAVAEALDCLEHGLTARRKLVPEGVELQGQRIARQILLTFHAGGTASTHAKDHFERCQWVRAPPRAGALTAGTPREPPSATRPPLQRTPPRARGVFSERRGPDGRGRQKQRGRAQRGGDDPGDNERLKPAHPFYGSVFCMKAAASRLTLIHA